MAGIIARPFRIPEWQWALLGAGTLIAFGLLPIGPALRAVADGWDVYLFLAGMLVLAELARAEGLFDWVAARMVPAARGSQSRLFAAAYGLGIAVTALLSNDGTILLLTPALLAVARKARVDPLPYAFSCAFVANAASFILPIGNPANLLVFRKLPGPLPWFDAFGLAALAAVAVTFVTLNVLSRSALSKPCARTCDIPTLHASAKLAAVAISVSAAFVVAASALSWPVGLCAFFGGMTSAAIVAIVHRPAASEALRDAHWTIIPLVAGLFAVVEALDRTGVLDAARAFLKLTSGLGDAFGNLAAGAAVTAADTIFNNLPAGVIVRYAAGAHGIAPHIVHAALIGVDLGPNLSASGSLATLLWIAILRRDALPVSPWQFLKMGVAVTVPALAAALTIVR